MVAIANGMICLLMLWNWRALRLLSQQLERMADYAIELPATIIECFA